VKLSRDASATEAGHWRNAANAAVIAQRRHRSCMVSFPTRARAQLSRLAFGLKGAGPGVGGGSKSRYGVGCLFWDEQYLVALVATNIAGG
jgi:hypothetical protein